LTWDLVEEVLDAVRAEKIVCFVVEGFAEGFLYFILFRHEAEPLAREIGAVPELGAGGLTRRESTQLRLATVRGRGVDGE
jgi:hypothetical protein